MNQLIWKQWCESRRLLAILLVWMVLGACYAIAYEMGMQYRAAVGHLLSGLNGKLDVVVPRGGKSLVARVQDEARVPVIGHLEGLYWFDEPMRWRSPADSRCH